MAGIVGLKQSETLDVWSTRWACVTTAGFCLALVYRKYSLKYSLYLISSSYCIKLGGENDDCFVKKISDSTVAVATGNSGSVTFYTIGDKSVFPRDNPTGTDITIQ